MDIEIGVNDIELEDYTISLSYISRDDFIKNINEIESDIVTFTGFPDEFPCQTIEWLIDDIAKNKIPNVIYKYISTSTSKISYFNDTLTKSCLKF